MNRIPEAVARFALTSFGFRFAAILLFFALCAGCGRTTNLDLEVEWLAAPAAEKQMLIVRSHEQKPLRIKRVVVNGEMTVQELMSGFFQVEKFRELTLTIGESATYAVTYPKRILYADIITDRGTTRYELTQVESQ
jgi:predicted Fe-S protein YdhL (DUF1289 family)